MLNVGWFNQVKKYAFYFVREGEKENFLERCACAISPTIAVTFAHGRNQRFKSRVTDGKGGLLEQGSVIKLYAFYNNQDQREVSPFSLSNKKLLTTKYLFNKVINFLDKS